MRLLRLAAMGSAPADRLAELVKGDPALVVRVLHAANAPELDQRLPVGTIERATALLGPAAVLSLALSAPLDSTLFPGSPCGAEYERWWRRSLIHAAAAELLCCGSPEAASEAFVAGLLLEIGHLLRHTRGEVPAEGREADAARGAVDLAAMRAWRLPDVLIEAIHARSLPLHELAGCGDAHLVPVLAVALRIGEALTGERSEPDLAVLQTIYTSLFGRTHDDLARLLDTTRVRVAALQSRLAVEPARIPPALPLTQASNVELGRLCLSQSLATTQQQLEAAALRERLEQAEQQVMTLQRQALRDPLTGVFNRQFFEETLDKEIRRCCRYASPIALLFLDVDGFKQLNDSYGHLFGDQVLRRVAAAATEVLRSADVLARYGGEEFVVLPNAPNESGLVLLAERLRQRIEQEQVECEGEAVGVTVSIGCTIALPGRHEPDLGARLIATADAAMYEAKHHGRNRICVRSLVSEGEARLMQQVVRSTFSRWLVRRGILDHAVVSLALLRYEPDRTPLGELALQRGLLTPEQVQRILEEQRREGERFGATATRLGLLSDADLVQLLALQREDPSQIAHILVGQGLLAAPDAELLLGEYLRLLDTPDPAVAQLAARDLSTP